VTVSAAEQSFDEAVKQGIVIRALAGTLILTSLVLSLLVGPWWLLLGLFVGGNLLQSAFTNFCPAERIMRRLHLFEAGPAPAVSEHRPREVG
jgi:DUF2892 family protein